MATPFSQTIRSLDADTGQVTLISLFVASLLLAGWLIWAFSARLTVYAESPPFAVDLRDPVIASFSLEDGEKLRIGQPAQIILDEFDPEAPNSIPGVVVALTPFADSIQAEILPDFDLFENGNAPPAIISAFERPTRGFVTVKVEEVSPAILLLRTSGLFDDSFPITTSGNN